MKSDFVFNLQLFGGGKGGGGSSTTVQAYQPTDEEKALWAQQAKYAKAVAPNALELNDIAMDLLKDSLGTVQVDFNTMNGNSQNQIANAMGNLAALTGSNDAATKVANSTLSDISNQTGTLAEMLSGKYGNLANGNIPSAYQTNMENSIQSALNNTMGKAINSLGNRGVLNSSVTSEAMNDIGRNAADAVAQQYQQNINQSADLVGRQENTLGSALGQQAQYAQQQFENMQNNNAQNSGIYGNLINSAATPITTAAGAQEAAISPAQNLWSSSLGLNSAGNATLAGLSGKGTTTSTTNYTTPNQGGGLFAGIVGAGINAFCFPAGTKILMADGTEKNIEDIVSGDEVATDSGDTAIVLNVMEPHYNEVYEVVCEKGKVRTTATQPLMMADGKNYVFAGDLSEGIELRRMGKVQDVHYVDRLKVYDFEVADDNQYIADGFVAMGGNGEIWGC